MERFLQKYCCILQTNILRIVGFYVRHSAKVYGQNSTWNNKDNFEYYRKCLLSQPSQFLSLNLCDYDPGLEATQARPWGTLAPNTDENILDESY